MLTQIVYLQVIIPQGSNAKAAQVELYSLTVKLFKHQPPNQSPHQSTTVAGVTGGIANFALSKYSVVQGLFHWLVFIVLHICSISSNR